MTGSPAADNPELEQLNQDLIAAAWRNDLAATRELLAAGADVNAQDHTQQSAFLIATSEGYLELLELALADGADLDAKDSYFGTGLIRAADRGHYQIVGRLLRAGSTVNHVNNLGWTALHEAVILGDGGQRHADTVRLLVAAGADVRLPSAKDDITPLQHAESRGFSTIAATLRAAIDADSADSADSPTTDRTDRTGADGILAAVASGDADAVVLALRAGESAATLDPDGRTPLELAQEQAHDDIVRILGALTA